MEQPARTGPSVGKIILIILIVVVVLLLAGIILVRTVFKEPLMRATMKQTVNFTVGQVRTSPPEGVDTAAYIALCDAFLRQVEAAPLNDTTVAKFVFLFQDAAEDKVLDRGELAALEAVMVEMFPGLEPYRTLTGMPETASPIDTLAADSAAAPQ